MVQCIQPRVGASALEYDLHNLHHRSHIEIYQLHVVG